MTYETNKIIQLNFLVEKKLQIYSTLSILPLIFKNLETCTGTSKQNTFSNISRSYIMNLLTPANNENNNKD